MITNETGQVSTREIGMETYSCSKCGKIKPVSEFYIQNRRGRTEVKSQCKSCASIYDKNRDKEKVHNKNVRYYKEHKETMDAKARLWQANHRERTNEIARGVYSRNIEVMRKRIREHYYKNRDKWKIYFHAYRTRKRNASGSFTAKEWKELLEKYSYTCLGCGKTGIPLSADHIIPLSKGGSNSIDNIQPLCKNCNSRKFTKTIDYRINYDY